MKVISLYTNFANQGGAQDRAIQLSTYFNKDKPLILTETALDKIIPHYAKSAHFIRFSFSNIIKLSKNKNVIFLSHHRKMTTKLILYNLLMGNKLKIVHCARNTFNNLKWLTLFPKNIIANSNGVKDNLVSFFRVKPQNVTVIFNGIEDCFNKRNIKNNYNTINILLAGRICAVKRQVDIVNALKQHIPSYIHIDFAGKGEDENLLLEAIGDSTQFRYIGHIKMEEHLNQYDYVLLFSEREGFSSSLIYGLMFSKPLITNDLPVMLDANKEGEVGFVFATLDDLATGLKKLPLPSSEDYKKMAHNARMRYEKYFKEEMMFEQYRKYFDKLTNNN